jgi:hypothetical protein
MLNENWTISEYNSSYHILCDGIEQTILENKASAELLLTIIKQIEAEY